MPALHRAKLWESFLAMYGELEKEAEDHFDRLLNQEFARAYAERYTSVYEGVVIQLVSVRIRCRGPIPELTIAQADVPAGGVAATTSARRHATVVTTRKQRTMQHSVFIRRPDL